MHHKIDLFEAIVKLKTPEELVRFFADLCTPKEVEAMRERWLICQYLYEDKLSYREINEKTGASLATIVRVARFLKDEKNFGYKMILERLENDKDK